MALPRARQKCCCALILIPPLLVTLSGCQSSLFDPQDDDLRRSILDASQRELADARSRPAGKPVDRPSRVESLNLAPDILSQLQRETGPSAYLASDTQISPDLLGGKQVFARVSLQRVVLSSVQNNLSVQFARIAPAINEARVAQAQAAFDFTLFGSTQYSRVHEPRVVTSTAIPTEVHNKTLTGTLGIRRRFESGATLTLQNTLTGTKDQLPTNPFSYSPNPNPARNSELAIQLDQPLLKNFGTDVNLAQIRIEQNAAREQVQELKQTLLKNVTDVEEAYWQLVSAHASMQISQRLLDRGLEVQGVLRKRMDAKFDVKQSQFSDAAAQVESRRADLIRSQNVLRSASDRLKLLINDPNTPVGGEILLLPVDMPVDEPIRFNLLDALISALNNRPEIQRALLSIDDASIRQSVADNQRLPELNFRAQIKLNGQSDSITRAIGRMSDADFVDYVVGLTFEQPIGNRAAESGLRARKLERLQTVIAYKDVTQRIVAEVKERLRLLETNYQLIEQTRAARIAAAENVRVLKVEEENIAALTPEFLDLKLRRQLSLAQAELQEIQAITEYNSTVARLFASMGTALERNRIEFKIPSTDAYGRP